MFGSSKILYYSLRYKSYLIAQTWLEQNVSILKEINGRTMDDQIQHELWR